MPDLRCSRPVRLLAVVVAAAGMLAATACAAAPTGHGAPGSPGGEATGLPGSGAPDGVGLLAQLRGGGVIIVIRHAATDRSRPDADERTGPDAGPVDFADCATQRNLTDKGRADARAIGAAFRDLGVPVGTVWTSPFCRSRETAELAAGDAEVIDGLERLFPVRDEAADSRINQLIREHAPGAGEPNLVISGHGVYPSLLVPAVTLEEGEAAIYALRDGTVVLLGRVAPNEWAGLA